jgi:serine/threonine protein phosphatase 1
VFKPLQQNNTGKDYFVGDIHGCHTTLMDKLTSIKFDFEKDRLISVGDLIDRGPKSYDCLKLISEPWFHAVLGNHEDMMIKSYEGNWSIHNYSRNGGDWFLSLSDEDKSHAVALAKQLPTFIEVDFGDRKIGVLHADAVQSEWDFYRNSSTENLSPYELEQCIWGRNRIYSNDNSVVKNIAAIVVGHTPLNQVDVLGNVVYIDTGAVFGNGLTVVDSDKIFSLVNNYEQA